MNTPAIEMSGVRKSYRFFALDDMSLRLEQGQIMGFVGPNGAGKTTTIRLLMAMIQQDAGEIRVLGHTLPKEQARAKWDIGYVSDDMSLRALRRARDSALGARGLARKRALASAERLQLSLSFVTDERGKHDGQAHREQAAGGS